VGACRTFDDDETNGVGHLAKTITMVWSPFGIGSPALAMAVDPMTEATKKSL